MFMVIRSLALCASQIMYIFTFALEVIFKPFQAHAGFLYHLKRC